MKRIIIRRIFRYDKWQKKLRLFRFIYHKYKNKKFKWSMKISLNLSKKIFLIKKSMNDFKICILFIEIHYLRHYGGRLI